MMFSHRVIAVDCFHNSSMTLVAATLHGNQQVMVVMLVLSVVRVLHRLLALVLAHRVMNVRPLIMLDVTLVHHVLIART